MPRWIRALYSKYGILGWFLVFAQPLYKLVDVLSNVQFVADSWQTVDRFIYSGGGFLTSFVAGCSVIGYAIYRSASSESDLSSRATDDLAERLRRGRERDISAAMKEPKPAYALDDAERVLFNSASFQDLGDLLIKLSQEIGKSLSSLDYRDRGDDRKAANLFFDRHARKMFGLYETVRGRGIRNGLLERVYANPQSELIGRENIVHLATELERFGHIVKIYR